MSVDQTELETETTAQTDALEAAPDETVSEASLEANEPENTNNQAAEMPATNDIPAPPAPPTQPDIEEPTMDAPAPPTQTPIHANGHVNEATEAMSSAQDALADGTRSYQAYMEEWADEMVASAEEIAARPIPAISPPDEWPPPLYIRPQAAAREIYYMQYRWYSQWNYYDSKASVAKKVYQRLQLTIGVGSVVVPVLIGLTPTDPTLRTTLDLITVAISLIVAAAAAIETVKMYGDDWRNYRSAAEELKREKSLYDAGSGPYRRAKNPFLLFVERCEDIMAKQNGAWATLKEETKADKEETNTSNTGTVATGLPGVNTTPTTTTSTPPPNMDAAG